MKTYYQMIEPLAKGAKVVEVGRTTPWISPQLLDLTSTVIIANAGKIRLINKQIFTNKYM